MITTWQDTMEAVVSDGCIVTTTLVQNFMQSEIDELRAENARLKAELGDLPQAQAELLSECKRLRAEADNFQMAYRMKCDVEPKALEAEIANLHTVMMAAAVEISEHWDAHCDADGYGPVNLVRRLENAYPAQYGYDAETVVRMEKQLESKEAEIASLKSDSERYRWLREHGFKYANVDLGTDVNEENFVSYKITFHVPEPAHSKFEDDEWDEADIDASIDAARAALGEKS